MTRIYYLFGSAASASYDDHGIEQIISNGIAHATFEFVQGETHPSTLLYEFDGWEGYTEITKEEYSRLQAVL